MPKIVVYSSGYCPYCHRARRLLESKGVEFSEIDVSLDRAQHAKMRELSGRTSVPQIFVGEHHVGGSDDLALLERTGELDRLLGLPDGDH